MLYRERALLYPYESSFCPVVRHMELLNKYEIASLVAPNGWGLTGKDAGCIDGGSPTGLIISDNFKEMLDKCDTVILTDSLIKLDFDNVIYPKIVEAVEKGKNIVSLCDLEDKCCSVQKLCNDTGVYFKQYLLNHNIPKYSNIALLEMRKIHTPIIFVLGVSESTHKFEIQMSLRDNLIHMGYNVSQVGTKSYCELLGFHSFPGFMYSTSISETNKVKLFNNYIKSIETNEKPDVIVIGIPGAIMKLNDIATNDFGILAFEVSQAVKPDAAILSMLYEDLMPAFSDMFANEIKYKFGFEIDCFNIANVKLDWGHLNTAKELKFITLGSDLVNAKIDELNIKTRPIFNMQNKQDGFNATSYLVDKLACSEFQVI